MGTIYIDQSKESGLISQQIASLHMRYAYQRALETQQVDDIGQDYLACRYSEDELAFCICDGVSLSYFGNLASKLLGDALTNFLWELGEQAYDEAKALQEQLKQYLQQLTDSATAQLRNHVVPQHISGMLREVLEAKKAHGSESTFVCGKVQFSDSGMTKLALAWAGDTRVRMWSNELEKTSRLGGQFLTQERWSTVNGVIGEGPHVYTSTAHGAINKLHIYTDGLIALDDWTTAPTDGELTAMLEHSLTKPTSDDITFLELEVR